MHEAFARRRRWRREARGATAPAEPHAVPDADLDPERLAFSRELLALLEAAVFTLPDGQREVFMLRDVEGLSTSEAAASLELSEDAVKTRLSRARATLRRALFERAGLAAGEAFSFHRVRCDRMVTRVMQRIA
jgi:RNA polymerase sigma-70 factor (ECF subfamily)